MKKQWIAKYELSQMHGPEHVHIPAGAQVLSVANQSEHIMVWVRCDPTAPMFDYVFSKEYTGMDIMPSGDVGQFLGTVLLYSGSLIIHVFYRISEPIADRCRDTWSGTGTFCPATHAS